MSKRFLFTAATAIFAISAFCPLARAATITYSVDEGLGSLNANGYITTDGSLGPLNSHDIVDYSLTITNGTNSAVLQNLPVTSVGDPLIVIGDSLFFNYSSATNDKIMFGSGSDFLCLVDAPLACDGKSGLVISVNGDVENDTSYSGIRRIGMVTKSLTPEPSSLALLGTGVLGLVAATRRRFAL